MSQPRAKRQRTEGDKDASITRSNIWYKDGSVVLQAQNTQFRVHWGLLSQNSSFFRDLEDLPQPPDQPTVDRCPVIELPDDEVDVEFVLKALYSPTFLCQTSLPFAAVAAHIRLGRKYDFKELLDSAVGRLAFENPTSFEEFEARFVAMGYIPTRITPSPGFYFDTVTLLSENRLWSLLPCACFRLVTMHNAAQLFDGLPRGDGTLASLSLVDLRRCVAGRERLFTKQFESGYTFGWRRALQFDACANRASSGRLCGHTRYALVETYSDGLSLPGSPEELSCIYKHLCSACCDQIKPASLAGFKKIWEELPDAFGVPALTNDP
ncbi:hypothetical protein B0H16DRAFT_1682116 [Mycena metata]|uniref:BTB domain-containing protein n=1 Tax=Mycena metata TaxID=1033252 RepID=A0AAD7P0I5_9AGAR|nr:hypothetical protein B0H16DRAFT_1682116 [Mycena metata]